jgi:hypothetical protein
VVNQMLEGQPLPSERSPRTCKCGKEMSHLGDLPQSRGKPAIHVFRCYGCNNVVSEPKSTAPFKSVCATP